MENSSSKIKNKEQALLLEDNMTRLFIGKVSKKVSKAQISESLSTRGKFVNLVVISKHHKKFMYVFFDVQNDQTA